MLRGHEALSREHCRSITTSLLQVACHEATDRDEASGIRTSTLSCQAPLVRRDTYRVKRFPVEMNGKEARSLVELSLRCMDICIGRWFEALQDVSGHHTEEKTR